MVQFRVAGIKPTHAHAHVHCTNIGNSVSLGNHTRVYMTVVTGPQELDQEAKTVSCR